MIVKVTIRDAERNGEILRKQIESYRCTTFWTTDPHRSIISRYFLKIFKVKSIMKQKYVQKFTWARVIYIMDWCKRSSLFWHSMAIHEKTNCHLHHIWKFWYSLTEGISVSTWGKIFFTWLYFRNFIKH